MYIERDGNKIRLVDDCNILYRTIRFKEEYDAERAYELALEVIEEEFENQREE